MNRAQTCGGTRSLRRAPCQYAYGRWPCSRKENHARVPARNPILGRTFLTGDQRRCRVLWTADGWVPGRPSFEGAPDSYTIWELAGKPVGGMTQMSDEHFPAEVPPHWSVCFEIADCDGTTASARSLGATVTVEPMDMPIGRFAGLIDPQGASFTVMQSTTA